MTTTTTRLPYGVDDTNLAAFTKWVEWNGYSYVERGLCLHWISGAGRCREFCRENRNDHGWMDHVTGWTKDGKPALLLCQPYHLHTGDLQDIIAVAARFNLDVEMHGQGWYGAGSVAIELRPAKRQ